MCLKTEHIAVGSEGKDKLCLSPLPHCDRKFASATPGTAGLPNHQAHVRGTFNKQASFFRHEAKQFRNYLFPPKYHLIRIIKLLIINWGRKTGVVMIRNIVQLDFQVHILLLTRGKLFNLSAPRFCHLQNRMPSLQCLEQDKNENIFAQHLASCLEQRKYTINSQLSV